MANVGTQTTSEETGEPGQQVVPTDFPVEATFPSETAGASSQVRVKATSGWIDLQGAKGDAGVPGAQGPAGPGVPVGGALGQVLTKKTATDYDAQWQAVAAATDIDYNGDWIAGSYVDGDIVVYQGVTYMCVRPTSAAPTPTPWATPVAPTSYSTTLPASPVDGQEAILVDSLTNPSYQWHFRYNALSTSPYKWEHVGGLGAYAFDGTVVDMTAALVGPTLTIPRVGEYRIELQCGVAPYVVPTRTFMDYYVGGVTNVAVGEAPASDSAGRVTATAWTDRRIITPAGTTVALRLTPSANTVSVNQRSITVTPRRVA